MHTHIEVVPLKNCSALRQLLGNCQFTLEREGGNQHWPLFSILKDL